MSAATKTRRASSAKFDGDLVSRSFDGTVSRVTFYAPDTGYFVVALALDGGGEIKVVGHTPAGKPAKGARWQVSGRYTRHPKHGEQFAAESICEQIPESPRGLEGYLASGAIPGIGRHTARCLIDAFGKSVLEIIESSPERLLEVDGIGPKKAERIRKGWEKSRSTQEIMVFLREIGIGPALASRVYRHFGQPAGKRKVSVLIESIRRNPYLLSKVRGIGFHTADACALRMGVDRESPQRIESGIRQAMEDASSRGHTIFPEGELIDQAAKLLSLDASLVRRQLDQCVAKRDLIAENIHGQSTLALPWLRRTERNITERIAEQMDADGDPIQHDVLLRIARAERSKPDGKGLSRSQIDALERIARERVCVLTGGPGTGKTTLLRTVVKAVESIGAEVIACAPTGRAAKRIEEAVGCRASTIHRALKFSWETGGFEHNRDNPFDAHFIVVDESSMIDVPLFSSLMDAVPRHATLLLVGDADQLPSVGPGAVLCDLIDSGHVPVARLTEIFRQAEGSGIAAAARQVLAGQRPEFGPGVGFEEAAGDEAWRSVVRRVEGLIREGVEPDEIQVLSPMKRGPLGTQNLNEVLREALNPKRPDVAEIAFGDRVFREGDRIIQTRNNYDLDVMNGDIGRIVSIARDEDGNQTILARFESDGNRLISLERSDIEDIQPAYAITIHKSQGGEYRAVVMALSYGHYVMLDRSLVYTGMTRARESLSLIGEERALAHAVRSKAGQRRWTGLVHAMNERFRCPEEDEFRLEPCPGGAG